MFLSYMSYVFGKIVVYSVISGSDYIIAVTDYIIAATDFIITVTDYRIAVADFRINEGITIFLSFTK